MAKQTWSPGTAPTGVGGDTPYSANNKHQSNADELYAHCGADAEGNLPDAQPINKGGTGATTAEQARQNLGAVAVDYGWGSKGISLSYAIEIDVFNSLKGKTRVFRNDATSNKFSAQYASGMFVTAGDTFFSLSAGYSSGAFQYTTGTEAGGVAASGYMHNDHFNRSIGYGQTWMNATAGRTRNTWYWNGDIKAIEVAVFAQAVTGADIRLVCKNAGDAEIHHICSANTMNAITLRGMVPAGADYGLEAADGSAVIIYRWEELRK